MEKRTINPWTWQEARNYVQAVEVKEVESTLYVSGQTAINADGQSSRADMAIQLTEAIQNLEQVINQADYECKNIVRLTVYHTSSTEFLPCFYILQNWIIKNDIQLAITVLEVKGLFETLTVELEATAVK